MSVRPILGHPLNEMSYSNCTSGRALFPLSFRYRNGTTINCGENQAFCAGPYTCGTEHFGVVTNCSLIRIWEIPDSVTLGMTVSWMRFLWSYTPQVGRNGTSIRPRRLPPTSQQIRNVPITAPSTLYSLIFYTICTKSNTSGMPILVAVRSKA